MEKTENGKKHNEKETWKGKGYIMGKTGNKKKHSWIRILGVAVSMVLLLLSWAMTFGIYLDNFSKMYLDVPTLLSIVAAVLLVIFVSGIEKEFCRSFGLAFGERKGISRIELQRSLKAVDYVDRVIVLAGLLSVLFPLVDLFYHMDNFLVLGPSFGVLSLGFLYTVIFLLILTPVKLRLERKMISYMEEPEDEEAERTEADEQKLYFGLRALGLTDREAEVARLAATGLTNAEIGQSLYISTATVKKHMTHILEKTRCADRETLANQVRGLL